jgi:homogentisate phytyltransferase/homogentisate geranylgeranyltransferase
MSPIRNFIRFSRPHTVIGTVLSISSIFLLAGGGIEQIAIWLLTIIACLGANIYIVGLNQLTDIEIDKVNKPYLPLASGAYSKTQALAIIGICVLVSIVLAIVEGGYLLATLLISILIGTLYSLPPARLKRFHFWAAFCIIAIRGLVVNLLIYLHFSESIQGVADLPSVIWLLTGVIFVYSIVIAWFKDIPDMAGDQEHEIKTLSLSRGADQVFRWGNVILIIALISVVLIEMIQAVSGNPLLLIIGHLIMILSLIYMWRSTNPSEKSAIKKYYLFIWALFFAEYILFGLSGI